MLTSDDVVVDIELDVSSARFSSTVRFRLWARHRPLECELRAEVRPAIGVSPRPTASVRTAI